MESDNKGAGVQGVGWRLCGFIGRMDWKTRGGGDEESFAKLSVTISSVVETYM